MKAKTLKTPLSNERGFTLVEVMIAMVILSIGILGTAKLQLSFLQSNAKARIMTVGSAQSQETIERLMSLPFDHALLTDSQILGEAGFGTAGFGSTTGAPPADHNDLTDPRYSFYWNVADDRPVTGVKTIDLIVLWNDEKNIARRGNYTFIKGPI